MKLALFGRGGMGRAVAEAARTAGHDVAIVLTSAEAALAPERLAEMLDGHDAAIDFSVAEAVPHNVAACTLARVPLVEGTTGWHDHEAEVCAVVEQHQGALVYGANFSVGVGLFTRLAAHAGALFAEFAEYGAFLEEAHHGRKRDAPSGTALRLRDVVEEALGRPVPVASTRAGHIPGTHRLGFDGPADQITLTHRARSRDGFAGGALLAAQWILGRHGVHAFEEVLDTILMAGRKT